MIGVMNDTWVGSTVPDGHTDRSDWQVSHRALTHGPADDTPRESVNDDGEVQPALVGVLLRHIGHPQLIGPLCSKRPLYEVWSGRTSRVSVRDPFRAPAADAFDAKLSHEASHAVLSASNVVDVPQLRMNARRTVGASAQSVDTHDVFFEHLVLLVAPRGYSLPPRIVTTGGDTQQTTHDGDGVTGLLTLHKPKHSYRVRSVSLAKKAAAFLESRAPREGSSLLVGVAVALRAPVLSSLLARLRRPRPAEPTCAATPRQFRDPGRSLSWVCRSHARDERPRRETQVGMVDAFAACLNLLDGHLSDTSLLCPPNRVKLRPSLGSTSLFAVDAMWTARRARQCTCWMRCCSCRRTDR